MCGQGYGCGMREHEEESLRSTPALFVCERAEIEPAPSGRTLGFLIVSRILPWGYPPSGCGCRALGKDLPSAKDTKHSEEDEDSDDHETEQMGEQ